MACISGWGGGRGDGCTRKLEGHILRLSWTGKEQLSTDLSSSLTFWVIWEELGEADGDGSRGLKTMIWGLGKVSPAQVSAPRAQGPPCSPLPVGFMDCQHSGSPESPQLLVNPGVLTQVEMVHPALLSILPFSSLSQRGDLVSVPGRKRMNPPLGDRLGKSSVLQRLTPSGCPRA